MDNERVHEAIRLLPDLRLDTEGDKSANRWRAEIAALLGSWIPGEGLTGQLRIRSEAVQSCTPIRTLLREEPFFLSSYGVASQLLSVAYASLSEEKWRDAVNYFQMAIASYPEAVSPEVNAAYHRSLARYYQNRCETDELPSYCGRAMKLFWLAEDHEQAMQIAQKFLAQSDGDARTFAWAHFVQGVAWENRDVPDEALSAYELAMQTDPSFALNLIYLQKLAKQVGNADLVGLVEELISELTPELFTWKPGIMQVDPTPDGWLLIGFDAYTDLLADGATSIPFVLFWLPSSGDSPQPERSGSLVQVDILPNLVLNAGFEWDWSQCLSQNTYLWRSYFGDNNCCFIQEQNGSENNHFASIGSSSEDFDSIRSGLFKVQASSTYLAGGWQDNLEPNPDWYVITMVYWYDESKTQIGKSQCSGFPMTSTDAWRNFRCLVMGPPGVHYGQVELLVQHSSASNKKSTAVTFDNVFFVPLPTP